MKITILDSKGRFTTMAKKAAKAPNGTMQTASAPAKPAAKKLKKHLTAQAAGVAAAVEGFVHAIANPHEEIIDNDEIDNEKEPVDIAASKTGAHASHEVIAVEKSDTAHAGISHETISKLAYTFYLERHHQNGSALDDWFRAERQLQAGAAN